MSTSERRTLQLVNVEAWERVRQLLKDRYPHDEWTDVMVLGYVVENARLSLTTGRASNGQANYGPWVEDLQRAPAR